MGPIPWKHIPNVVELVIGIGMRFNGLRGNSEVSAQKAKYTNCFVGYIVNVLVPLYIRCNSES